MRKVKKLNLIVLIAYFLLMALGTAVVFIFSANYSEIYDDPRNINAVVDLEGFESQFTPNLNGKWEFFYNRWIVTDKDMGEPDGMIHLPGRWTGMELNGKKLPRTGYASYRMKVVNTDNVKEAVIELINTNVAYRAFINGQLTNTGGVTSKNRRDAKIGNVNNIVEKYIPSDGETLVLVIEISDNEHGGLLTAPRLQTNFGFWHIYDFLMGKLPLILVGILITALFFCVLLPVKASNKETRFTPALFVLTLLLHYLTTKDMVLIYSFMSVSGVVIPILRFISGVLLGAAHILHMCLNGIIRLNRAEIIIALSAGAASILTYFLLIGSVFQFIPIAALLLTLLWVSYKITANSELKFKYFFFFITINTFLTTALFFEGLDSQGLLSFGFESIVSLGCFIILVSVVFLNFYKMREAEKLMLTAAQTEAENANMKKQALKERIKPHFMFNALAAIQRGYRKDFATGDEMLTSFSKHLRVIVDSDEKELIPFEDELGNMLNYFMLETLRKDSKLEPILNTEFLDFCVPVLSLQPFLENAAKHSGILDMENGQIQISSRLIDNGDVIMEIFDNGCGFDTGNLRSGGVGLKNATDRLKYELNAEVAVTSAVGEGTTVSIIIPAAFVKYDKGEKKAREEGT